VKYFQIKLRSIHVIRVLSCSVLYQIWSASLLDWPKQELRRYVKDQCFTVEKPGFWEITFIEGLNSHKHMSILKFGCINLS
jgi:hypothetical protein